MEYLLRILGVLVIVIGAFVVGTAVVNLTRAGMGLTAVLLVPAVASGVTVIVAGILFLAFGTVVGLLRRIANNTGH